MYGITIWFYRDLSYICSRKQIAYHNEAHIMHNLPYIIKTTTIFLLLGTILAQAQTKEFPVLAGHLLYTDYIEGNDRGSIAALAPESSDTVETLLPSEATLYSYHSFFTDSCFVCPSIRYDENNQFYILYEFFDTRNWQHVKNLRLTNSPYYLPYSAVYLPEEKNLFMLCYISDMEHYSWVTISAKNYIISRRAECPEGDECFALCLSSDGTIYGFSRDGYLCSIDRNNYTVKRLFQVKEAGGQMQASYYDPTRHAIYRSISTDDNCTLYRYDLIAEEERAIRSYNSVTAIHALVLDSFRNELRIPAAVRNLNVTFQDHNAVQTGTIYFIAPTTDMQSHALSSYLRAIISIDQVEADTVTLQAGQPYYIPFVFPAGEHTLSLQTYNEYGKGALSHTRFFSGYDYPLPIKEIDITTELPIIRLQWERPEAMHNGILNTDVLRYRVTRYPDLVTISDTTLCEAADSLPPVPGSYYYGITAYIPSYEAEESFTEPFYYDCIIEPPYHVTRWNGNMLDAFTIEDTNNDGYTWQLFTPTSGKTGICYRYHTVNKADDRLYTPALRLKQDTLYEARLYLHAGAKEFAENFSAYITYAPCGNLASQHTLQDIAVQSDESRCYRFSFSVPTDTLYNLCIHCHSEPNRYMLHLDSLSIAATGLATVPDSVTDFTLTQGYHNRNIVSISCKAPQLTAGGDTLASLSRIEVYRNDTLVHTIEAPERETTYWFTDSVTHIGRYRYTAVALNEAGSGIPACRDIVLGACDIPYRHDFSQGIGFCTVVDNNRDNNTWHLYTDRFIGCIRYLSSETKPADDWLVTPPLHLTDTMRYEVHCRCCAGLSLYPESLRIALGRTPYPDDMSYTIKVLKDFNFINDSIIIMPFDIAAAGHYYIGIQACSDADSYAILIRDIAVQEYDPAAVTIPRAEAPVRIWGGKGCMTALTSDGVRATIYDVTGRRIMEKRLSPGHTQWDMPTGVYIVQVDDAFTFKIVVL